jgi:hypothetical protein
MAEVFPRAPAASVDRVGKNDQIFPPAGAEPYKRDLKTLEYHLLDAGHFALETEGATIARLMREFLGKHVSKK